MNAPRKWLLGGIASVVLVFLLGFFLLVNPVRNSAAETWDQVQLTQDQNVQLAAKLEQLKQQSAEVPAKLDEIAAVNQKMPPEMKQSELVRSIESEAGSAGVDLTSIAPSEPTQVEGSSTQIVALPMTITATGRYPNLKTFVDNLERLDRAFLINTLDVAGADTATDEYTLTLNGNFFSLPEGTLDTPDPAATAPEPAPAASAAAKTPPKQHKPSKSDKAKAKARSTEGHNKSGK